MIRAVLFPLIVIAANIQRGERRVHGLPFFAVPAIANGRRHRASGINCTNVLRQPARNLIAVAVTVALLYFISDAPNDDAWMIAVTVHHRVQIALPPVIEGDMIITNIFSVAPTIERLINHQHAQPVASLQESRRGWVVRAADGIESTGFEDFDFALFRTRIGGCSQNSVIVMHTAALQQSRYAVEQEP